MIKLFGWEAKISERIRDKREDELIWIRQGRLWTLANNTVTLVLLLPHGALPKS